MARHAKNFENEWFAIALSSEVGKKKPHALTFFGTEIALWRTSDGKVCAVDAMCPHQGASLAVGRVEGDSIECPYHGFRFNGEGNCVKTPLREPDALIPRTLCTRHYAVEEKGDWVFLFWGEPQDATGVEDIPFFDEIHEPLRHEYSIREWPVSFTRFIENTVDVAHLKTVHKGWLSHSIPDVITVRCSVEDKIIRVDPPSTTDLPVCSKIAYPNLALLYLHPKFLTVFVAVPVDEYHTRVYVRSSQAIIRFPVIGWMFSKIKHWADMAALWQDQRALFSVRPIRVEDAKHEVLMDFDPHVAEYRKMRQRKLAALNKTSNEQAA